MSKKIKFILTIFIFTSMLLILTGCSNNNSESEVPQNEVSKSEKESEKEIDLEKIYLEVLEEKRAYVNEDNGEVYLKEYLKQFAGMGQIKISYTVLDMDNDNAEELVALFEGYDGFYLILNYEDEKVYGFEDVYRGMLDIKTNGYYYGSGGAASGGLLKSTFNKNIRNNETLAEQDYGIYKIAGEEVSEQKYNEYIQEEYYSKESVQWKELKNVEVPESEQSSFEGGVFQYTVTEETENYGATETLTFENGKVKFEESYFGTIREGIYVELENGKVKVTYTTETIFNQSTNRDEITDISKTVTYTVNENSITMIENGITKVYTKK